MAYRLLRYQDRIWERWRALHPKAKKLPRIIPIVMYHGVAVWSEPRSFDALLDVPPGLRLAVEPYLVRFTYLLLDLSEIGPEAKDTIVTAGQQLIEQGRQQGLEQGPQAGHRAGFPAAAAAPTAATFRRSG